MKKAPSAVLLLVLACAQEPVQPVQTQAETSPEPDPYTLESSLNFRSEPMARFEDGSINVVVEIPAGTTDKWEVEDDGVLRWEFKKGQPRVVQYLAYPANYGMVPRTLLREAMGGDGDALDVVMLGPSVERGSVVRARVLGVLKMLDGGESDHKLIAVQEGTALARARDLESLDEFFPGVSQIVEIWFSHYKGPGEVESLGFSGIEEAEKILDSAIEEYEASQNAEERRAA